MRVSYRLFVGFAAAANFLMERRKKKFRDSFFCQDPKVAPFHHLSLDPSRFLIGLSENDHSS